MVSLLFPAFSFAIAHKVSHLHIRQSSLVSISKRQPVIEFGPQTLLSTGCATMAPSQTPGASKAGKREDYKHDANIRNFAPVARIMKTALPENAKIAKEAKECMQECVSEFISFITSEGSSCSKTNVELLSGLIIPTIASEKCHQEKRKTVNGEDILFAMTSLGFENYAEALKIYLSKYREVRALDNCLNPGPKSMVI